MYATGISFETPDEKDKDAYGWSKVTSYRMFYAEMDFVHKYRWALDGHKKLSPIGSTCTCSVSRESTRIDFVHAILNVLDHFVADAKNDFLQCPLSKKYCETCGTELGLVIISKRALIRRSAYGIKSSRKYFRNNLKHCAPYLNFNPCYYAGTWLRP